MNEVEIYKNAVLNFGVDETLDMTCEECAKLIVAISEWKRGKTQYIKVIEQGVGVEIMINQLREIFPKPIEWKRTLRRKLNKLRGSL